MPSRFAQKGTSAQCADPWAAASSASVFRYALCGRKETGHDIVAVVARGADDQTPKAGIAKHARNFTRTGDIAYRRGVLPDCEEIPALENLIGRRRAERIRDVVLKSGGRIERYRRIGRQGHLEIAVVAAPHRKRARSRFERDRLQFGRKLVENDPGARECCMTAEFDFRFRREPAQIVMKRTPSHEERGFREVVLIGDPLHETVVDPGIPENGRAANASICQSLCFIVRLLTSPRPNLTFSARGVATAEAEVL